MGLEDFLDEDFLGGEDEFLAGRGDFVFLVPVFDKIPPPPLKIFCVNNNPFILSII
jgi:hypothetical protein